MSPQEGCYSSPEQVYIRSSFICSHMSLSSGRLKCRSHNYRLWQIENWHKICVAKP